MASEAVGVFVVDERDVAVLALRDPVAVVAFDAEREAATVLEEDDLFVVFECFADVVEEELGEVAAGLFFAGGVLHVDAEDLGHLEAAEAVFHFGEGVFAGLRIGVAFEAWCRGTEDGASVPELCEVDGAVASVVAW